MKKILILIILGLSMWYAFAFTNTNTSWTPWEISKLILGIINFLNVIWLPFAILAGKLFTNDFVYWSFLHLDVILWKIWNFSKTIANYALAFILFFSIFGLFIWKVKNIWNTLLKLWLATVLINMSWFLVWALIDISTILLISVWSFPLQIIWNANISTRAKFCQDVQISFSWNLTNIVSCKKDKDINASSFLEKANSLAWPLVYIWQSILGINWALDKISKKVIYKQKPKWKDVLKVVSLWTMIQFIVVLLFVVPIVILLFIWVVRVFWLWIYIWFSPLIILDQIFGGKILKTKKEFELKNIIWLIFQPVLIVFAMWIAVVFLVGIQSAFIWGKADKWLKELGVCWDKHNALCLQSKKVITIQWNLLNDFVNSIWGVFGYIILLLLSTLVLWSMIKVATKSSELTANISQSVYQFAEDTIKAVPIVPIAGGVGIWAIQKALDRWILKRDFDSIAAKQASWFLSKYGLTSKWDLSIDELKTYTDELKSATNFNMWRNTLIKLMRQIKHSHPDLVPANSPNFRKFIYTSIEDLYPLLWTHKDDLKKIWFLDSHGKKLSESKVFAKREFREFVTWLFMNVDNSNVLTQSNFNAFVNYVLSNHGRVDYFNKPINEYTNANTNT